ncbi:MAG: serine/threonine protein kinase [Rubripirellula sp.]
MRFLSRTFESPTGGSEGSHPTTSSLIASSQTLARHSRRFAPLLITALGFLLLLTAIFVGFLVRRSLQDLTRDSLRAMLSANVSALELWLKESTTDLSNRMTEPNVESAARMLLNNGASGQANDTTLTTKEAHERLARALDQAPGLCWALLDSQGVVVTSDHEDLIGEELSLSSDAILSLTAGRSTVSRPFRSPIAITDSGPMSRADCAVMCSASPVMDGARWIGSLTLLMDPLDRFTDLLSVARTGGTGETYAFDREGRMISQSRFEHHLRAAGLLDSDIEITSPLNISIRDPGVNLTAGESTSTPREQQPLTLMADQATRGATGQNTHGYNDYRGVPVVGAWTWMPAYGIGIATEMDVTEAYRPLRLLQNSFVGLLSIAAFSGVGLFLLAYFLRRINQRLNVANRKARKLGQYELGEIIGRGGMGAVYCGRHQLLKRDVAVKVLEGEGVNEQSVTRFEREVQMTCQLRHPNTIDIYDFGHTEDGTFFYVMEFINGITLQELVENDGRQPPGRVIHLLLQICGSLSEAHQLGMIHRDIKPSNILLAADAGIYDSIKVLDFGLVKEIDAQDTTQGIELTQSDGITGTPMYMSPESVRDAATATHQSDLYSVGAVGFTLLTGKPPFEGDSSVEVCLMQLNEMPVRPSERIGAPLPEDLQNVLMSCLRKEPEDRPMTINDFEEALKQCRDASSWKSADALRWWEEDYVQMERFLDAEDPKEGAGTIVD